MNRINLEENDCTHTLWQYNFYMYTSHKNASKAKYNMLNNEACNEQPKKKIRLIYSDSIISGEYTNSVGHKSIKMTTFMNY